MLLHKHIKLRSSGEGAEEPWQAVEEKDVGGGGGGHGRRGLKERGACGDWRGEACAGIGLEAARVSTAVQCDFIPCGERKRTARIRSCFYRTVRSG